MKYNYIRRLCSLRSSVFAMPLFILLLVLHSVAVSGQFLQQGAKLSGNDIHRPGNQGSAVALSADGNTAIVGGPYDGFTGAAWIFTRTGGVWSQEGLKLVGAGNAGFSSQGYSVGISADGNTAIVGGPDDDNMTGAAWIFTRSGGTWTQHGTKLVGQGAIGAAAQGVSVGISADGQTAVIGGSADNYNEGAVWVFARTGDSWLQQGPKLVGSGGYEAIQGFAVSISGDGNTIVVGGPNDYFYTGAAWVFKRSGGIWTQHGDKLLVSGAVEDVGLQAGRAVSIAADGNTIILGGPWDDYWTGAAWIFTLEGNEWLQQGSKLVGSGATEDPFQGYGVSLSADGNTAVIGGPYDENYLGSSWIFRRNGGIWTQQGNKLSGTGTAAPSFFGWSTAISADGKTTLMGGHYDNNSTGAVWAFVRSGDDWLQQGEKLVGSGGTGYAYQGYSVDISGDGNTALVGGYYDRFGEGGTWVYTRTDGQWSQQGSKLVGSDGYQSAQGYSVALSGDGNTAIVGGPWDNGESGAAWIFRRDNGAWTQEGGKLYGSGAIDYPYQGRTVAISGDGNTVAVCGPRDNFGFGAVWVFVRSGNYWYQQGAKLVPSDATGNPYFGRDAAFSDDGNTLVVSGTFDNNMTGAAWIFTRSNGVWSQQGGKLVGSGAIGNAGQGVSVDLSADGNTMMMGGTADDLNVGAAWIFTREAGVWTQFGDKLVGTGSGGSETYQGVSVSLSADGTKAILGGYGDDLFTGATWVFKKVNGIWIQQGDKLIGSGAVGVAGQGFSAALSGDGTTVVIGGLFDNANEGATWIFAEEAVAAACDIKQIGCMQYELLRITENLQHRKTYTVRVTNLCDDQLVNLVIQVPNGMVASAPANGTSYLSPKGKEYVVRNPNYSPFYSIRFTPQAPGIKNGDSDEFRYTLPPQANPAYIRIMAKLESNATYEAHMNVSRCEVEPETPNRPADGRDRPETTFAPGFGIFPNPSGGTVFVDLSMMDGQAVQMQIFNTQGQLVLSNNTLAGTSPQTVLLPESLADGLYRVSVTTQTGEVMHKHFLLQRRD